MLSREDRRYIVRIRPIDRLTRQGQFVLCYGMYVSKGTLDWSSQYDILSEDVSFHHSQWL